MKLFTWNVNGIRSVFRTTFREWLAANDPDIVCLQEIKADAQDLAEEFSRIDGYYAYFNSSSLRKGHSGTAVYSKAKPRAVETKLGPPMPGRFDDEGRVMRLDYGDFTLFNFYMPNGARDQHEIPYKLQAYRALFPILAPLADTNAILTGDFNIAHTAQDVYYAKQNERNTMFTPAEREQITKLLSLGYADAFREKYPDKKSYTWWPYMRDLRERDIGWRIDYFFVSKPLRPLVMDAFIQRETLGSDHAPFGMVLDKDLEIGERPVYAKTKPAGMLF